MNKYLLYAGMFLGSFLVINVGMYFLLSATQPQSAIGSVADSTGVDSLVALHGDSLAATDDSSGLTHPEEVATLHEDSTVKADSASVAPVTQEQPEHPAEIAKEKPAEQIGEAEEAAAVKTDDADVPAEEPAAAANTPMSTKEISKLAKMLEGMKPVEAAAIAERLPDETIVQLVLRMKSRAGAKMMAALPVPIAASVAARMAELSGVGG